MNQKKSPLPESGSGLCSLPHVGCEAIVNEVLARMHAALQNDTGKFKNQEKTDTCVWLGADGCNRFFPRLFPLAPAHTSTRCLGRTGAAAQ